jgi:polar amino acid transport system substrate-binding protein
MKFAYLIEPPFNDRDDDGAVKGCDVELAQYVCDELGEAFAPIEAEFAELLPGLGSGRWRMTTGLFATEERQRIAAFSRPIWALPDGLLVQNGNPKGLDGYRSVAAHADCLLAVIRDQIQHRSAVAFGVSDHRIVIFDTYTAAAIAVATGDVDAYASVARAHAGFMMGHPDLPCEIVPVPAEEKAPAFGAFGFAREDDQFRMNVDAVLATYLGSPAHRAMMARYGFADDEIDLLFR